MSSKPNRSLIRTLTHHALPSLVKQILLKTYYRRTASVYFARSSRVSSACAFEGGNRIGENTLLEQTSLGYGTYVATHSEIRLATIGRFCSISDHVRTCVGKHPTRQFISSHPAFYSLQKQAGFTYAKEQLFQEHDFIDCEKKHVVHIGHDVLIGYGATLMDGLHIGHGAIIGANSLVTKNVEPYAIVAGAPARVLRYRFAKEEIDFLLALAWWNKDREWIKDHARYFYDINELKRALKNCS